MLVLNRKPEETIVIDGNIIIKVLDIQKEGGMSTVRLGIDAPREIPVHRGEVQEQITQANG